MSDQPASRGDEYHHPDGSREIVVAVTDDRVLTVREYAPPAFAETVADADYRGVNDDVAALPPAEAFGDD